MKILLIIILIVSCPQLWAEGARVLKGRVTDVDQQAIPFATVVIEGTDEGTAADIEGNFELNTSASGKVVLIVASVGYTKQQVDLNIHDVNDEIVTITLDKASVDINEVIVQGDSKATQIEKSGFAVTSIDTKDLQIKSAEVNEILDQIPGLRVRRDGGMGSKTTYNINGLSGNAVRIFIDGVPMESFGSSYSINSIPVSLIERVDVYKGVVPIEFGNDAMGGAINIVTKKPSDIEGAALSKLNASYSVGSFNSHRADINGSHINSKNRMTLRYSAFYNYSDNDYHVWSDDIKITDYEQYLPNGDQNPDFLAVTETGVKVRRFNDAYESYGAKVDLGITQTSWADQLFFSLNMSEDYKESQHGPRMLTPYGERFSEGWTVAPSLSYSKQDFFLEGLDITANMQYSLSQRSTVDTSLNTYDWYGNIIPNIDGITPTAGEAGSASLNIDHNNNTIASLALAYTFNPAHTIGANFSHNYYARSSDDELQLAENRSYNSESKVLKRISGFNYQNQLLDNRLKNTAFVKHYYSYLEQNKIELVEYELDTTYNSRPSSYWGYGATSTFALTPKVRFSASAEKAVRLVSTNEVFGNISDEIEESIDLEPEKSLNINLGGRFTILDNGHHRTEINSNFFYRDTYDRIRRTVVEVNDESYSYHENIGHVRSKGTELQLDYSFRNSWNLMLQGYYLDSRFMEQYADNGAENDHYLAREPNMPYLTASASLGYIHRDLFRTDDQMSFNWYSSYIHAFHYDWDMIGNANKPIVPAQFINDVSLSYRFANHKLSLSLDGKNIFNTLAFDNYGVQKPGRAFYVKISYSIL